MIKNISVIPNNTQVWLFNNIDILEDKKVQLIIIEHPCLGVRKCEDF